MDHALGACRIEIPVDEVPGLRLRPRVGRPPIEESIGVMTPSQFHTPASETWWPAEKRLMLAVLTDAIDVLLRGPAVNGPRHHLYEDTAGWLGSEDTEWPYSFVNICDALGLDVESVRTALTHRREEVRPW